MAIDINRLIGDAENLHAEQKKQPASGTYAAIREALTAIEAMRANGIAWRAIADALGQQGITQRQGNSEIPITASRLTSLVSDLKSRQAKAESKQAGRMSRADLSKRPLKSEQSNQFALADELNVKPRDDKSVSHIDDEETIRRAQFDAMKGLLKQQD